MKKYSFAILFLFTSLTAAKVRAQFPDSVNTVESRVIPYTLPDPLLMPDGKRAESAAQWEKIQRPYLYGLFEKNVYGRYPRQSVAIHYKIRESSNNALGGIATRKQIRIFLKPDDPSVYIDVLLYLPNNTEKPVPVFLGLNFHGNATIQPDPQILLSNNPAYAGLKKPNDASARGKRSSAWPVQLIVRNGFGVATACYCDIEMDSKEGWKKGIRTTMKTALNIQPQEWGAIGAWAWGLSRILDYLEKDPDVNARKVAVLGHSRLGKTALWAGASDTRFSIVISNDSGEGGAALARRWFGETHKVITTAFPWWFSAAYNREDNVFTLPVDQHELLALIAPRPLYVGTASLDLWADPKGMFLAAWHAGSTYQLFNKAGLGTNIMPPADHPIGHTIGFHLRTGKHALTYYDWEQYLNFAKRHWSETNL